jgi:hypothetical protein
MAPCLAAAHAGTLGDKDWLWIAALPVSGLVGVVKTAGSGGECSGVTKGLRNSVWVGRSRMKVLAERRFSCGISAHALRSGDFMKCFESQCLNEFPALRKPWRNMTFRVKEV